MKHLGLFISFEGPDGSGKSAVIKSVNEWLIDLINQKKINYKNVLITREPGGKNNILSEKIRSLLLDNTNYNIPSITEALLFASSRSNHVIETILPALKNNEIVICDRYVDSSYVYQGMTRNIGLEAIKEINNFATQNLYPDLTLILMVSAEIGLSRIKNNNRKTNRIDLEGIEFHKQVERSYLELYKHDKHQRLKLIDANQSFDNVLEDCKKIILEYINEHK